MTRPQMDVGGSGGISRRAMLKGAAAGISYPALAAFLTACGQDSRAADDDDTEGLPSPVHEINIAINESPWLPSFEEVAKIYEVERGVRVNLHVFPYDELRIQQVDAATNRSDAFDIFSIDSSWVGQFYDRGWVTPLEEITENFAWRDGLIEYDFVARWDPKLRATRPDAPIMGVPINGNMHLFMYRSDLYDQLGLVVPETWDEALLNAEEAGDAVEHGYVVRGQPADAGTSITFNFGPVLHSHGGDWFIDPGIDWTPAINTSTAATAMETYRELAAHGPSDPRSIGQGEMLALLQNGQSLQCHMVAAVYPHLDDREQSSVAGQVGYAVVPRGRGSPPAPLIGVWTQCIPSHIPHDRKIAALYFLRWITLADVQRRYAEAGGIVTTQEVYESDLAERKKFRYMEALGQSSQFAYRSLVFPFSQQMAEVTERWLADILVGEVGIERGLDRIAVELERIVEEAGYT